MVSNFLIFNTRAEIKLSSLIVDTKLAKSSNFNYFYYYEENHDYDDYYHFYNDHGQDDYHHS